MSNPYPWKFVLHHCLPTPARRFRLDNPRCDPSFSRTAHRHGRILTVVAGCRYPKVAADMLEAAPEIMDRAWVRASQGQQLAQRLRTNLSRGIRPRTAAQPNTDRASRISKDLECILPSSLWSFVVQPHQATLISVNPCVGVSFHPNRHRCCAGSACGLELCHCLSSPECCNPATSRLVSMHY